MERPCWWTLREVWNHILWHLDLPRGKRVIFTLEDYEKGLDWEDVPSIRQMVRYILYVLRYWTIQ